MWVSKPLTNPTTSYIFFITLSSYPFSPLSIQGWWWCGSSGRCLERWWWELHWNHRKWPPLARIWMWGRWWWWEACWNAENNHLWLTFGCKGGGGGKGVGRTKKTTSSSHLNMREVVVVGDMLKHWKKSHCQLAFGCKGGGGWGECVETTKKTTFSSHLDVREMVVGANRLKQPKKPPLAHIWMQGRWWWWWSGCNRH